MKLALLVALATAAVAVAPPPAVARTRAADAANVRLADQRGERFNIAGLRGVPVVVTFVASRCTETCPIANAVFAKIQERLRRDALRGTLLTVTLDPDFDSPMVMARIAQTYGADPSRWRLASGTPRAVRSVMTAFGVSAERGADGIPDSHSTFVYVLDPKGALARTLLLSSNTPDDVAASLRNLMR
jgi:protein SCO1/2